MIVQLYSYLDGRVEFFLQVFSRAERRDIGVFICHVVGVAVSPFQKDVKDGIDSIDGITIGACAVALGMQDDVLTLSRQPRELSNDATCLR